MLDTEHLTVHRLKTTVKAISLNKESERNSKQANNETPALPAYFLSMTIANYRCFGPKQTLNLSKEDDIPAQWTIILGDNGVGKTTLLQCLAAGQTELETALDGKAYYIPAIKRFDTLGVLAKPNLASSHPNFLVEYNIYLGDCLNLGKPALIISNFSMRNDERGIWLQRVYYEDNLNKFLIYGYGANRRVGKSSISDSQVDDKSASLFSDDVDLLNAEEWLLQADYIASRSSQISGIAAKRRDQVKETLIDLLPEVNNIRFFESESVSVPSVEFNTPYGWVPLKGLSLGYRTLITWMVDLASRLFERYPDSPNPLAEPAIVLIDEIDLHLHPRWQRTLMQFLTEKFPNTQFIATAHSPLVVQSAVDANIVLLRREGDHVVIDNDVETIKNWRVDQILTSELFGLESARPPQSDAAMAERNKILSKARLTKADEKRLEELERQIGNLPTGETPEDLQAMDIIRRAAQLLKTE